MARKPRRGRYTPSLGNIHLALTGGHINDEEAVDLNPDYKPGASARNILAANKAKNPAVARKASQKYRERKRTGAAKVPSLVDVHDAVKGRRISFEEGADLNPKYENKSSREVAEATSVRRGSEKSTVPNAQFPSEYRYKGDE